MFSEISIITYGRITKTNDWTFADIPGTARLYFIHSGNAKYIINNEEMPLLKNHIYLFPSIYKFNGKIVEGSYLDHTFFDFISTPAVINNKIFEIDIDSNEFIKSAFMPLFNVAKYHSMYSESTVERNEYYDIAKLYLDAFISLLDLEFNINKSNDEIINKTLTYIHNNIQNNISIELLAKMNNFEKNYFIRYFKKRMMITPYQYIKNYKLNFSLSLIKKGYSISEIASFLNYTDYSAFSNQFKKAFKISPKNIFKK